MVLPLVLKSNPSSDKSVRQLLNVFMNRKENTQVKSEDGTIVMRLQRTLSFGAEWGKG